MLLAFHPLVNKYISAPIWNIRGYEYYMNHFLFSYISKKGALRQK